MQTCSTSDAARGKGQDSLIDLNDPGTMRAVDGTYNVILLGDILEHLVDPGRVLLELKERLNERGPLLHFSSQYCERYCSPEPTCGPVRIHRDGHHGSHASAFFHAGDNPADDS